MLNDPDESTINTIAEQGRTAVQTEEIFGHEAFSILITKGALEAVLKWRRTELETCLRTTGQNGAREANVSKTGPVSETLRSLDF
jgi:hypothetical protein